MSSEALELEKRLNSARCALSVCQEVRPLITNAALDAELQIIIEGLQRKVRGLEGQLLKSKGLTAINAPLS